MFKSISFIFLILKSKDVFPLIILYINILSLTKIKLPLLSIKKSLNLSFETKRTKLITLFVLKTL